MNTLPRALTALVIFDSEHYEKLRLHWSGLMRSSRKHELTAAHHLLYLALLGKDWRQAFTPITNRRKLDNGAFYGWAMFKAIEMLHSPSREVDLFAPFDGLVTHAMLQQIRQLVAFQQKYLYRSEHFEDGFPFEAYNLPESIDASLLDDRERNA